MVYNYKLTGLPVSCKVYTLLPTLFLCMYNPTNGKCSITKLKHITLARDRTIEKRTMCAAQIHLPLDNCFRSKL